MQHFSKLRVWQRSHQLTLTIYKLRLPSEERDRLQAQLRDAAASVGSNIAEGAKRATARDYAHFLNMSQGSINEVENWLLVCRDLGYLEPPVVEPLIQEASEISRMLHALRDRVLATAEATKPAPRR